MAIDWQKVRYMVHRRTIFCSAAVVENDEIRQFPIGSLSIGPEGISTYFEMFARPVQEGQTITFMAVDTSPFFWLVSLLKGRFLHPPAIRLTGVIGPTHQGTSEEVSRFRRRIGLLLKTPGGQKLWGFSTATSREVHFTKASVVKLGSMTRGLENWLEVDP
jgi:hypothetical protein